MAYSEDEWKVTGHYSMPGIYGAPDVEVDRHNYPITPKENIKRMFDGKGPMWIPNVDLDVNMLQPYLMADAKARGFGGIDFFGIEWEYEPLSKAAMVKPGTRVLSDITEWREEIKWPDLSAIDWAADYEQNYKHRMGEDRLTEFVIVNGFFERTADLTSFEDAFEYLITEPEELAAFYDRLAEWHIELIDIAHKYYHADMILFHDDMGTQINSFFSPDTYEELFMPQYKKMTKAAHDRGMYIVRHSCGCIKNMIPLFIEDGWDGWEGQDSANDKLAIMEEYGDKLAQWNLSIIPPDMSDEDALKFVHDLVDGVGKTGRFGCRLRDMKPGGREGVDLWNELYKLSREKYAA